jgi:hypothetical protein
MMGFGFRMMIDEFALSHCSHGAPFWALAVASESGDVAGSWAAACIGRATAIPAAMIPVRRRAGVGVWRFSLRSARAVAGLDRKGIIKAAMQTFNDLGKLMGVSPAFPNFKICDRTGCGGKI